MSADPTPDLATAIAPLGDVIAIFAPSRTRTAVGGVLGFAIAAAGVATVVWFAGGWADVARVENPTLERWGTAGVGLAAAAGGVAMLFWMWSVHHTRVLFQRGGLTRVSRRGVELFPWEAIAEVREEIHGQRIVHVPGAPESRSVLCVVVRNDGVALGFDRDHLYDCDRLRELVRAEATRRAIPWETRHTHS